jgi:hypothetical protein
VKDSPGNKIPWKAISIDRTITGFERFEPDYSLTNCMMTFITEEYPRVSALYGVFFLPS